MSILSRGCLFMHFLPVLHIYLKCDEVNPRTIFHYGLPSGSHLLANDPIQKILAMSTIDGRIKLFGQDNTQAVIQSPESVPSKFLQFFHNQQFLINVNAKDHIEVWDIEMKSLFHVHVYKEEITSFTVLQRTFYMYVGDSCGNVSVLQFDKESCNLIQMKYRIPFSAPQGNSTEDINDAAVMYILPQPAAESKRILIIYKNGFVTLWSLQDSKPIYTTGGTLIQSLNHDNKKVTAACWACPFGSKVVIGYNNCEILMWSIPHNTTEFSTEKDLSGTQSGPLFKLNLGYKLDKIPISRLKFSYANGNASRLYVLGASDFSSANLLQVIIINEQIETRTTKMGIATPEPYLSLLKETTIIGLTLSISKPNSLPDSSICASQNGDIIMVNADQEVFIASVLLHRHLDSATQVYNKDLIVPQADHVIHKEKKKGIFSSMIKGSKPKHEPETEQESARESFEELSTLFSVTNFPYESETIPTDEDDFDLDIDDIDIDGPEEKSKGNTNTVMGALNKQKLTSKFNAFKGKLKEMSVKKEKVQVKEEPQDEKTGSVDEIKKKYGFNLSGETSAAKMAQNKLSDNIRKLKGINLKTAEMQDNAQTFSSMAKQVLRTAEK